jgi:hypothetical protein
MSTVVVLAALAPAAASAREPDIPERTPPETHLPNRELLRLGASTFLVPYVSSVIAAAAVEGTSKTYLVIPLAGPWLTLATRNCAPIDPCNLQALGGALLILDGALQALGAGTLLAAFFVPERERVPVGITVKDTTIAPTQIGASGYGLGATGRF